MHLSKLQTRNSNTTTPLNRFVFNMSNSEQPELKKQKVGGKARSASPGERLGELALDAKQLLEKIELSNAAVENHMRIKSDLVRHRQDLDKTIKDLETSIQTLLFQQQEVLKEFVERAAERDF